MLYHHLISTPYPAKTLVRVPVAAPPNDRRGAESIPHYRDASTHPLAYEPTYGMVCPQIVALAFLAIPICVWGRFRIECGRFDPGCDAFLENVHPDDQAKIHAANLRCSFI
jgi:hypothetical protein